MGKSPSREIAGHAASTTVLADLADDDRAIIGVPNRAIGWSRELARTAIDAWWAGVRRPAAIGRIHIT